jgi:hypothetical protein
MRHMPLLSAIHDHYAWPDRGLIQSREKVPINQPTFSKSRAALKLFNFRENYRPLIMKVHWLNAWHIMLRVI